MSDEKNPVMLTLLYAGEPLIEVMEDGQYRTVSAGVNMARLAPGKLDVESTKLKLKLTLCSHAMKMAGLNPWRDAMISADAVHSEIPVNERRGMNRKDVSTVIKAIDRIAQKAIQ